MNMRRLRDCKHGQLARQCNICELEEEVEELRAQLASERNKPSQEVAPERTLAKHQPCGCVICTCEDEVQCQGCGAKHCGTHQVGEIPSPVFEPAPERNGPDCRECEHFMFRESGKHSCMSHVICKRGELFGPIGTPVRLYAGGASDST